MAKYELELFEKHPAISLYTIRYSGDEYNEFEKFVLKFPPESEYAEDLDRIISWLDKIIEKGALERYFRNEGKYNENIKAIPIEVNNLRLYCLWISPGIIILGNGDIKNVKKWQDDSKLTSYVSCLQDISKTLKFRIRKNLIIINGNDLTGNLLFGES